MDEEEEKLKPQNKRIFNEIHPSFTFKSTMQKKSSYILASFESTSTMMIKEIRKCKKKNPPPDG